MIISFANQKGGVGKTTMSICTAFELAKKYKILMVDMDPQNTIYNWLNMRENKPIPENLSIESVKNEYEKKYYRTSKFDVSKFLYTFRQTLEDRYKDFDLVMIDTPPRLTDITRGAIGISDMVIIPCRPSPYDAWATQDILELLGNRPKKDRDIKAMIAINMKSQNSILRKSVRDFFNETEGNFYLAKSEITSRTIFPKTASLGLSVQEGDRDKKASKEVESFVEELLEFGDIS